MTASKTIQPVATSVRLSPLIYSPRTLSPQNATRSVSKNPGVTSSQSSKVRTVTELRRRVPGFVVDFPLRWYCFLVAFNIRLMVDADMCITFFLNRPGIRSSFFSSRTLTSSGMYGASRCPQMPSAMTQSFRRTRNTS